MSQGLHLVSNNIPGYGLFEEKCCPCLGVSERATCTSSYSCSGEYKKYFTQFKVLRIKIPAFASKGTSLSCSASSSGQRRNPEFSRQNKHGFSRGRNRQNQDNIDNVEESELFSSKNGPLLSLSSSPRFQATATPGPREKEIVELFRKVQAQLRERAATKEEKKNDASRGKSRQSDTVDSLLKLLRKHSIEQGNKTSSSNDFNFEQPDQNTMHNEEQNLDFFGSNNVSGDEEGESSVRPFTRPASNFQRRSPVPRVKYQPVYSTKATIVTESPSESHGKIMKSFVEPDSEPEPEPEFETEPEHASHPEPESIFSDGHEEVLNVMSESEPEPYDDEILEEPLKENTDLSALKLSELRSLAKSRGVKGYSKMKKGDLIELLIGDSA